MGHAMNGIICQPSDRIAEVEASFGLPVVSLGKKRRWFGRSEAPLDFVLVPLQDEHCDAWSEKLGLPYKNEHRTISTELILDCPFAHHVAAIATNNRYALVATDYFGGNGVQAAAVFDPDVREPVYHSGKNWERGAINTALKKIGVIAAGRLDEFDTLCLGYFRCTDDFFYED